MDSGATKGPHLREPPALTSQPHRLSVPTPEPGPPLPTLSQAASLSHGSPVPQTRTLAFTRLQAAGSAPPTSRQPHSEYQRPHAMLQPSGSLRHPDRPPIPIHPGDGAVPATPSRLVQAPLPLGSLPGFSPPVTLNKSGAPAVPALALVTLGLASSMGKAPMDMDMHSLGSPLLGTKGHQVWSPLRSEPRERLWTCFF